MSKSSYLLIEEALLKFHAEIRGSGLQVSHALLLSKSTEIRDLLLKSLHLSVEEKEHYIKFKGSIGCIQKFCNRNVLGYKKEFGEADSVDMDAAKECQEIVREAIKNYNLNDVYNVDETGMSIAPNFYYRKHYFGSLQLIEPLLINRRI